MSEQERETLAEVLHPWLDGAAHCPYRPTTLCVNHRRSWALADVILDHLASRDAALVAEARAEGAREALRWARDGALVSGAFGTEMLSLRQVADYLTACVDNLAAHLEYTWSIRTEATDDVP